MALELAHEAGVGSNWGLPIRVSLLAALAECVS